MATATVSDYERYIIFKCTTDFILFLNARGSYIFKRRKRVYFYNCQLKSMLLLLMYVLKYRRNSNSYSAMSRQLRFPH